MLGTACVTQHERYATDEAYPDAVVELPGTAAFELLHVCIPSVEISRVFFAADTKF
jgi:hypothetical protein